MRETTLAAAVRAAFDCGVGRRFGLGLLAIGVLAMACGGGSGKDDWAPPEGALVSTLDGVTLTVVIDPTPVGKDEDVRFVATLRNGRGTDVDYAPGGCAFSALEVTVSVPWEPTGRTWTGSEDRFKTFLLRSAFGPGGVPAWAPIKSVLLSTPCDESSPPNPIMRPGEILTADFSRAIRNARRTYQHAATFSFSISADIDRQNEPPPAEPGNPFPPRFFPEYRHVAVEGELTIAGRPTDLLTAGEAIDVLLGDERYMAWLNAQRPGTCESANLHLDTLPPTHEFTVWFIQLMCETGVPRHDGFGAVDAVTGEIRRLDLQDTPAD